MNGITAAALWSLKGDHTATTAPPSAVTATAPTHAGAAPSGRSTASPPSSTPSTVASATAPSARNSLAAARVGLEKTRTAANGRKGGARGRGAPDGGPTPTCPPCRPPARTAVAICGPPATLSAQRVAASASETSITPSAARKGP